MIDEKREYDIDRRVICTLCIILSVSFALHSLSMIVKCRSLGCSRFMQVPIEVYARSLTQLAKKRKRKRHDAIHQPTTLVFNSERVNSRPRIKGRGYEICRCCSKAIMEPGCRYYYARCVSRTTERSGERTNSRASALVQGRFGMLITDQHTYPSLAPLRPTAPCHGLPRLPTDSSWNGPHRRSRCTQGSRETDESTLRPETLVLPSFELAARAAR